MLKEIITVLLFVQDVQQSKQWYQEFLMERPIEDLENFALAQFI